MTLLLLGSTLHVRYPFSQPDLEDPRDTLLDVPGFDDLALLPSCAVDHYVLLPYAEMLTSVQVSTTWTKERE